MVSLTDETKLYDAIRQSLVCGFFSQVAHKEGDKGNYVTVKDNQLCVSDKPQLMGQYSYFSRW